MKIAYYGKNHCYSERVAIITFKQKESDKFEKIAHVISENGYKIGGLIDNNEYGIDCYIDVDDLDDFNYLKDIYLDAKREKL